MNEVCEGSLIFQMRVLRQVNKLLVVTQLASGSPEFCIQEAWFQGLAHRGSRHTCGIGDEQKPSDMLVGET